MSCDVGEVTESLEMKFRVKQEEKIYKDKIKEALNVEKLTDIEKCRLKWFGHVKRMEKGRLTQRMLNLKVKGKCPRGRPWERCINHVKKNLQELKKHERIEMNGGIFKIYLSKGGLNKRMMIKNYYLRYNHVYTVTCERLLKLEIDKCIR